MKHKLGFWSIVLLGINMIVGTGIFLLPSSVYQYVGTHSVFVVLITAFLTLCIALCFAEAAGIYHKNGGAYIYVKETMGEFPGFVVGFTSIAIGVVAWATIANAFITMLFNTLGLKLTLFWHNFWIVIFVIFLTIINLLGVKFTRKFGNIITVAKLIPLVVLIVVGLFFIKPTNFVDHIEIKNYNSAVLLLFYAFTGFESIAAASEDMENSKRNLSRALLVVILVVSSIYTLIIVTTIGILGDNLARSASPIADAMRIVAGDYGFFFISIGALISMFGINLANSFLTPRGMSALAKDNLIPSCFGKYNEKNVPVASIICVGVFTILVSISGSFEELVPVTVILRFVQYIPTCMAIIILRIKQPKLERHFKIPFGITLPVIGSAICIWLITFAQTKQLLMGIASILIAIVFYFIMKNLNKLNKNKN